MSPSRSKHRQPKFRVSIEFTDSEQESVDAFMRAMKVVLGDDVSPSPPSHESE